MPPLLSFKKLKTNHDSFQKKVQPRPYPGVIFHHLLIRRPNWKRQILEAFSLKDLEAFSLKENAFVLDSEVLIDFGRLLFEF